MENRLPKLKLLYFDITGKGEPIRWLLTYLGIPFEDHRFSSRDEFLKLKNDGTLQFGQVPALVVDSNTVLTQSAAILRYIGQLGPLSPRKVDPYPLDSIKAALVDAIMDQEADSFAALRLCKYTARFGRSNGPYVAKLQYNSAIPSIGFSTDVLTEEVIEDTKKHLNTEVIPKHLSQLQTILEKSETGWLAGRCLHD